MLVTKEMHHVLKMKGQNFRLCWADIPNEYAQGYEDLYDLPSYKGTAILEKTVLVIYTIFMMLSYARLKWKENTKRQRVT